MSGIKHKSLDLHGKTYEEADILIDGGNSYFKDTQRREKDLAAGNVRFFGMGISGGAMGALLGPSLMPGGKRQLYDEIQHVLEAIAAQLEDGSSVTYCGSDGAGHFVKMVHNGIEYGDMQLIAEAYHILRDVLGLESIEIADIFAINKADREGTEMLHLEIQMAVEFERDRWRQLGWEPLIVETTAFTLKGVRPLWEAIGKHRDFMLSSGRLKERRRLRAVEEVKAIVADSVVSRVEERLHSPEAEELIGGVLSGRIDPYSAADIVMERVFDGR